MEQVIGFVFSGVAVLSLVRSRNQRANGNKEKLRRCVAVDLDEVLGGFLPALIDYHNDKYGTSFKLQDFHSYRFCEVWGGTNEEATIKVHDFFETKYFLEDLKPIAGAKEVLEKYKDDFEYALVTSRQHEIEDATLAWLDKYYPNLFSNVLLGNHWARHAPDPDLDCPTKRTKADMCRDVNAILLIDDSLSYSRECAEKLGIQTILFGQYGWNQLKPGESLHENTTRAENWEQVDQILSKLVI